MENQIVSNVQHLLNNYHEGHPPDKGEKISLSQMGARNDQ